MPTERPNWLRLIYVLAGHLCVAIGVIAIVVPLLPTTPFLLLAVASYARGSDRFHDWLLHRSWFASHISSVRERRGVSIELKIATVVISLIGWVGSFFFLVPKGWGQIATSVITLSIIISVLRQPTRRG
ncbi:MAG: YbaN family protein [Candidatus Eisenbacteria bacterium]|nr:YbaN family protein [Candidatus Eisenbacteria bacterium]MCC7143791.1 YbaN family protein [Candidatus Eisenbacteria bacterium]